MNWAEYFCFVVSKKHASKGKTSDYFSIRAVYCSLIRKLCQLWPSLTSMKFQNSSSYKVHISYSSGPLKEAGQRLAVV